MFVVFGVCCLFDLVCLLFDFSVVFVVACVVGLVKCGFVMFVFVFWFVFWVCVFVDWFVFVAFLLVGLFGTRGVWCLLIVLVFCVDLLLIFWF